MNLRKVAISLVVALLVASCATQPPASAFASDVPGFWMGLVQGAVMPFSLIASLFWDVRIYAFPNSGGWYDLGYFLGTAFIFGGGGLSF
jgi:hypothetical protein